MSEAVFRLHHDGERVQRHARLTIIAERDLATARIEAANARTAWDNALRDGNSRAAADAAIRYHAMRDTEHATALHLAILRADRDRARADFRDSAREVRRLAAGRRGPDPRRVALR
jgi:hypothetical protein